MKICPRCSAPVESATRFCPHDGTNLERVPDDPYAGQVVLGQFEVREPLGGGAMGAVYRAWQTGMERAVAVKVLHAHLQADPDVVKRFAREARAVARLSHPNIVTVYVIGQTADGAPCLVMELVEGEPLEAVLGAGILPTERTARIVRQIVSALADAHAAGVVHRDLKPANVMLTQRRRAADFVKILDFGIAKIVGSDSIARHESELTREGDIFGTPYYLSPEQAAGAAVDHRADLYSVGVMLFRMLCGRVPFQGSGMQVVLAHINDPVPHPRDLAPGVDEALAAIAMRCLEKDPARRYQSAEELADALDEAAGVALSPWAASGRRSSIALAPESTAQVPRRAASSSHPDTAGDTVGLDRPPRGRGRAALSALGALVIGVGAGLAAYQWRAAREPAQAPPRTPAIAAARTDAGAVDAAPPAIDAGTDGPRRTVIVSEGGYSFQALVPEPMVAGGSYDIELTTWDPAGDPLTVAEIVVTLEEPGGIERGFTARRTKTPGRYRFTRAFRVQGTHYLHVFPPRGNTSVKLWLDVLPPERDN